MRANIQCGAAFQSSIRAWAWGEGAILSAIAGSPTRWRRHTSGAASATDWWCPARSSMNTATEGRYCSIRRRTGSPLPPRLPITGAWRSEEHTSELQSLMRLSSAVFCLKKTNNVATSEHHDTHDLRTIAQHNKN